MKKVLSALLILFISACSSQTADAPALIQPSPAPPTEAVAVDVPAPVCIAPEPTQEDIDRALAFTGKIFDTPDWQRSYTVAIDKVSVTWYSESLTAIAFLEVLIFPCSYEEPDLDIFFSDENWGIVFGNYQSYGMVSECFTDDGIRLYEFTALDQVEYDIHYWAVNDTDTRVITMMLVLPVESEDLIEEFSYSLFPQLSSC